MVAGQFKCFRINEFSLFDLGVLAKVDQHRAGASTAGDIKSFAHNLGNFFRTRDQEVVFGDWLGDLQNTAAKRRGICIIGYCLSHRCGGGGGGDSAL